MQNHQSCAGYTLHIQLHAEPPVLCWLHLQALPSSCQVTKETNGTGIDMTGVHQRNAIAMDRLKESDKVGIKTNLYCIVPVSI